MKKEIYIAGPITGVPRYCFAVKTIFSIQQALLLVNTQYLPLSPARMPDGMENGKALRICLAMIDAADAVLFLPGSSRSRGASLEHRYCEYTGKPWARSIKELKEAMAACKSLMITAPGRTLC